jgi:hypothetical protein
MSPSTSFSVHGIASFQVRIVLLHGPDSGSFRLLPLDRQGIPFAELILFLDDPNVALESLASAVEKARGEMREAIARTVEEVQP